MEAPTVKEKVVIAEPVTTSDPWQLMAEFYASPLYKKKLASFFERKTLPPDVTEKEKEMAFLSSDSAEYAFLDFGFDHIDFRFDSSRYSQPFLNRLEEYRKEVKDSKKMSRQTLSDDEVIALDSQRFSIHSDAARELVKAGIAPTDRIGRAIVSIILVELGLEDRQEARRTTLDKIKWKVGGG